MFPLHDIKLLLLAAHVILGFYEIRRPRKNLNPIKVVLRLVNYKIIRQHRCTYLENFCTLWPIHIRVKLFTDAKHKYLSLPNKRNGNRGYCATSHKVAGSIPDGVTGIFHWNNPNNNYGPGVHSAASSVKNLYTVLIGKPEGNGPPSRWV